MDRLGEWLFFYLIFPGTALNTPDHPPRPRLFTAHPQGISHKRFRCRVKTTAVIAIDDSPSMERHDRNGALWSQATGAAATVLGLLQDGDEIVLLPFSAAHVPSEAPDGERIRGIARARSALADLRPGTVSPSLHHVLRASAKTLELSDNAQRELYLISDFQEGLLSADSKSTGDGLPIELDGVRAYGITVGDGTSSNLGITGARIANSILEQGKTFTLAVTMTNSSTTNIRNSVVSVFLNGNRVTAKALDVDAGTSPTFDIPVVAGGPGFVNGRVRLDDDEFPFDNVRYFGLNLRRELRVLLVGPSPSLCFKSLDALLAERGLHVDFVEGDAWALRWSGFLQCSTFEPWEAVGRDVYDYMPAGRDGAKLRSLMNEIQMLLHDHPINARRVRGGRPAVNSLWLWGAGAASAPGRRKLPPLLTDDAWLKGIWRACGSEGWGWTGDWPQAMRSDERVILAPTRLSTGSWDASLFRPLRELLGQARAGELQLLIHDRTFTVTSSARWRFWCRPRGLAEWIA